MNRTRYDHAFKSIEVTPEQAYDLIKQLQYMTELVNRVGSELEEFGRDFDYLIASVEEYLPDFDYLGCVNKFPPEFHTLRGSLPVREAERTLKGITGT